MVVSRKLFYESNVCIICYASV